MIILMSLVLMLHRAIKHFPMVFDNENIKKKIVAMSGFILLDVILARWQHLVASSEALDLLH